MDPCTCGHSVEEHPGDGACDTCDCAGYDPEALDDLDADDEQ